MDVDWTWNLNPCALFEQYLVSKNFHHIPRAFFTVNAYLGIALLGFCILDLMAGF